MSLRHAILGFLSIRPMSGYDLKRTFDTSVRHFWSADQAAIYRMLSELETDELVAHERIAQDARPDRKVFSVTAAGLQTLDKWLVLPTHAAPRREPLLVKLFFAGRLGPELVQRLASAELASVTAELHAFGDYIGAMAERASQHAGTNATLLGPLITLANGVALGIAYRDWLQELTTRAANGTLTAEALLSRLQGQLTAGDPSGNAGPEDA